MQADVYVLSIDRKGASALERQDNLNSELHIAKTEGPVSISRLTTKHAHTTVSLQLLARLRQAVSTNETTKLPAGDARLVDAIGLLNRHLELLEARGIALPKVTDEKLIERLDWRGNVYATSARLVHSELLEFYRASFRDIAADALKASERTTDQRAKSQFDALHHLSTSLEQALNVTTLKNR